MAKSSQAPKEDVAKELPSSFFKCEACDKTSHEPFENTFGDSTVCSDACFVARVNKSGYYAISSWVDER